MRSNNNEIIGGLEIIRDRTERKRLWETLRQERDKAQQYLRIAGVMIVALNAKGEVTLINKKGCEVMGYKEEEIIGSNWFDSYIPKRIRKEVKEVFQKVMAGKTEMAERYENPILTKGGEEKIIEWYNTILADETGRTIGTLSSGEDITKRKQTEAELIRAEKLGSLGQLAAGIAHEVNNPLTGVLIYMKLLLKKYKGNRLQTEETEKQLLKIEKETERCSRIIRNLLDFSRQSEPSLRPVDLNKVVEAALSLVGHQISLENIGLDKKLETHLLPVLADFDQIQQVLINIILNATQAMPDGGKLAITTSFAEGVRIGESAKNTVRIDISDTGVGISKENLGKLFTPFFTSKEKGKGVGLGLSVVHGIIQQHKGKMEVESKPNVGTTFTIYLEVMDEEKDKNTRRRR